jgi:hypothetical protein
MGIGRPPLPVGTIGKIRLYKFPTGYRALALVGDFDGRTREVDRTRPSKGAAERALRKLSETAPIRAVTQRSRQTPASRLLPKSGSRPWTNSPPQPKRATATGCLPRSSLAWAAYESTTSPSEQWTGSCRASPNRTAQPSRR